MTMVTVEASAQAGGLVEALLENRAALERIISERYRGLPPPPPLSPSAIHSPHCPSHNSSVYCAKLAGIGWNWLGVVVMGPVQVGGGGQGQRHRLLRGTQHHPSPPLLPGHGGRLDVTVVAVMVV